MHDLSYLRDLLVILAAAVVVVTSLHRFGIPAIAGFILAGIIVGPSALSLIADPEQVKEFSEIGVALLLFGIGMELSLDRLKRLWRSILIGGSLQVGLSVLVVIAISTYFGLSMKSAIFLGFFVAISSTAIVLRGLQTRGEVDAPHGRLTLGILVFQDLCVVPMMLAIPLLAGEGASGGEILEATVRAVAIIVGVLFLARLIVPRALHLVALTRQRHLFVLSVLLVCIGTAWIVSSAGVSLALGAFLAGLVVAGSEYRHQAFADLISFRDVFTSVFFVSIGMMLDLSLVVDSIAKILLLLSAVMIGKFMIVFLSAIIMRLPLRVAVLSSAALSQIGEFSFILAFAAVGTGLFVEPLASEIIAVAIISMLITPFILALAPHLAAGASKMPLLSRLVRAKSLADISKKIDSLSGHVIIGGYGFAGMELANALRACDVPYVIAELNPDNIRRAIKFNEPAYYGDVTSAEELERLGAARASELVLVINDPGAVERAVAAAKSINPKLHIIVRTRYLLDIAPLLTVGANEVVPAELEAAAEVVSRILRRHGVADDRLLRQSERIHRVIEEKESE